MRLWVILKNDLKILLKDRGELISLFLLPLAFILPVGFALGGGDGYGVNSSNHSISLPVLNYDGGVQAQKLLDSLKGNFNIEMNFTRAQAEEIGLGNAPECFQPGVACDEAVTKELLARSFREAALTIPAGFSAAIDAGQKTSVVLQYDPVGDAATRQQIEGILKGQTISLTLNQMSMGGVEQLDTLLGFAPESVRNNLNPSSGQTNQADQKPVLNLVEITPSSYELKQTPDTYQQTVPGYTVMFVFFIIGYISSAIKEEKHDGTFRRLLSSPVSRAELIGGKMLTGMVIGLAQVAIMFAAGVLAFGLQLGRDWLSLLFLTLALSATATCMGLAASTSRSGGGLLTAPLIIFALLGGCMVPLDIMPGFLRGLSYFIPHSWALTGYQNLMVRGQGLVQVLPQIGMLLVFAVVFFAIALWRFDFEES